MACSSKQGIAPELGQLVSLPAGIEASLLPQTALLSKELCQVGLPNGSGLGANWFGSVSGLRKCVRICCTKLPKVKNNVACGLEGFTVQDAPVAVGRHT